jgi:hypothetical protein
MKWALESTLGLPFAFQWPRSTLRFTERLKLSGDAGKSLDGSRLMAV